MALLDPYTGPWTEAEAAHLARRAGFGGTPARIAALVGAGMNAAVDSFVDYPPQDAALDALIASLPDNPSTDLGKVRNPLGITQLQGWWLYRMRHTNQPLQEQLTLFLHDTLASEYTKVGAGVPVDITDGNDGSKSGQECTGGHVAPDPDAKNKVVTRLMRAQNELFRTTGHGGYRDLLLAVSLDPAMLLYLDNYLNINDRPQENYAREVMELFSMGVGNYSETDVREVARAFTGEGVDRECSNDWPYTYKFTPSLHDPDPKTVFGDTFNLSGAGREVAHVIDLIVSRVSGATISPAHAVLPATAIHMAWKLINWFVSEDIPIDHAAVAELADHFHNDQSSGHRLDVRTALRRLFKSAFFYDPAWRFAMFKHPADYVVMALRNLEVEDTSYSGEVARGVAAMGMSLFMPPNVAGWNHGRDWINSGNLIARFNYADRISRANMITSAYCNALIPAYVANQNDVAGIIEYIRARLIQTSLRAEETEVLHQFAADIDASGGSDGGRYQRKVRGLVHLMMTLPAYQLK